jgi:hypothetical protein
MLSTILAIGWEPELRGLLTVVMAVVVFGGSTYLVLGTNLGARLGFLVTLAGLFGWMVVMGLLWWIYGIGLIGPDPSWRQVEGRTVIQDVDALYQAGVVQQRVALSGGETPAGESIAVGNVLVSEGWNRIPESEPSFGQAAFAAGGFLTESGAFSAGETRVTAVYEIGGERYPKINETFDFLAFFHKPRFALVEVAPLEPLRLEPGRAPVTAEIDQARGRQYVYLVRDLGARRQPPALITIGSTVIFLALCALLHRRDKILAENRSAALVPAG